MLEGLQHTFETVSRDRSANVLMICSSVNKVFCAGADLKVKNVFASSLYSTNSILILPQCNLLNSVLFAQYSYVKRGLQERKKMSPFEVLDYVTTLRSTFSFLEVCIHPSSICSSLSRTFSLISFIYVQTQTNTQFSSHILVPFYWNFLILMSQSEATKPLLFFWLAYQINEFLSFQELQIPTIAVVEGAALGGGLEMALSCDLRICGKFQFPQT